MRCLFALAFTLFAIASESAFSQEPRYLLDVEGATPGKEIVISRPPNGLFPIRVVFNVAPPANFSYFATAAPPFALLGDITPAWSSSHVILTKDPDPSKWGQGNAKSLAPYRECRELEPSHNLGS
jgi:hypothetical protein